MVSTYYKFDIDKKIKKGETNMESMGLTGTDALAVMNSRGGYGYNDGFGADGGWFWIIILFALWGNNGWNNGNNDIARESSLNAQFTQRDIFNTNQNVSSTSCQTQRDILETKYDLGTQILENRYNAQLCCCATDKEVLENRYQNALQTQTLSSQLADCCCQIRQESLANSQKIIDLINQDKIDQLREQVNTLSTAYNNLQLQNNVIGTVLPRAIPAYPSCSPYVPSYYGFGGYANNGCGCGNTTVI